MITAFFFGGFGALGGSSLSCVPSSVLVGTLGNAEVAGTEGTIFIVDGGGDSDAVLFVFFVDVIDNADITLSIFGNVCI